MKMDKRTSLLAQKILLSAASLVLVFNILCIWERYLRSKDLDFLSPILVVSSPDRSDWREYHMFMSGDFMPDPYLFWKLDPKGGAGANAKGFKGADFSVKKPASTYRVACLGDSDTQGLVLLTYPRALEMVLGEEFKGKPAVEVINAGVAGYTSFQGARQLEELLAYKPDLVTVCFGWNDATVSNRGADKTFKAPSRALMSIERYLYRFKSYQLLKYQALKARYAGRKGQAARPQARVDLYDFSANLTRIARICRDNGIKVVFITRPFTATDEVTANMGDNVRPYNEMTRVTASTLGVPLIDAERVLADRQDLFLDCAHLTMDGYRFLAEKLAPPVREAILEKYEGNKD